MTYDNILGIISLFSWLLIIVVFFKYTFLVMDCDQHGEGGVLVLSSLAKNLANKKTKKIITSMGIIGVALFVGDSVITPAISVLSACEGLKMVTNLSENHIVFFAVIILFILFIFQRQGSGKIGKYFGYIMLLWFTTIGCLGIIAITKNLLILSALNPYYAIKFIINNKLLGLIAMGGSILVVSGVEALYADIGHFGKNSIRTAWTFIVFPCLTLNYLGQGALLLQNPLTLDNIFYHLAPENLVTGLIFLSLIATIIASQAVISGIFSLTKQAIMLNYLPRLKIIHTSSLQEGQVYLPAINYLLLFLTISAVAFFKSSENLSFAYGLSVASVMIVTTILTCFIAYYQWHWSKLRLITTFLPLISLDILFVITNLNKIFEGAWYTILIAYVATYVIFTWRRGNHALKLQREIKKAHLETFLKNYIKEYSFRIPGCAVFMTKNINYLPGTLLMHLKHNKFLHEKVFFVSLSTEDKAKIEEPNKFHFTEVLPNIFTLNIKFGFHETPNLNKMIEWTENNKILKKNEEISFFLSRGLAFASNNSYKVATLYRTDSLD